MALTSCSASASPSARPTPPTAAPSGPAPAPKLSAGQHATVTYCNGERARITEPSTLHGPAPAAVYVHGGAWVSGNYGTGGFLIDTIGPNLAAQGLVVVSVDYRLGPKALWPDQIVDVKCAIRYLRANTTQLNIDPNAIGAWGQSAGGHLVALLGTAGPRQGWDVGAYADKSSRVEAVVDMAGPSDLLTLGNQGESRLVTDSFVDLLGRLPHKKLGADLRAASPVTYVAPGDPPFLLLHSTDDEIVYPQQSNELSRDLAAKGVPHQLLIVEGGGHEFDNPGEQPTQAGITRAVADFFVRTLVFHLPITSSTTVGSLPAGDTSTGTTGNTGNTGPLAPPPTTVEDSVAPWT
jgi:acetyl esterase/lipase